MKPGKSVLSIQRASRAAHIPPDARLRAWARQALAGPAVVTLRYVAQAEGRRLNLEFRGKDYATNVLTFIYGRDPRGALAGDIVICAPVVAREAKEQGKAVEAHHAHLLVHGRCRCGTRNRHRRRLAVQRAQRLFAEPAESR